MWRKLGRSKQELKSTTWVDFTYEVDLKADSDNIDLLYEGKIDGYSMKKRFIRPDGSIVWVNMTVAHLTLDHEGGNHVCIKEDFPDQKKMEDELQKKEQKLIIV